VKRTFAAKRSLTFWEVALILLFLAGLLGACIYAVVELHSRDARLSWFGAVTVFLLAP
jgi:hypothetical protein